MDVDTPGKHLYYADPVGKVLYKVRLSDGKVLEARNLPFAPVAMALDGRAKVLYLVDDANPSLVRVRQF